MSPFLNCGICKKTFNDPYVINCGHTFCKTCVQAWANCQACGELEQSEIPNHTVREIIESRAQRVKKAASQSGLKAGLDDLPANPLAHSGKKIRVSGSK